MNSPTGSLSWYVIGRFYTDANNEAFDVGYFPHITGLTGPFFKGDTSNERTAFFTFYADKFTGTAIQNGNVAATLFPPGDWSMYLIDQPSGNWQNPESFKGKADQKIATWSRKASTMSTTIGTASLSLLTFELKESWDFEWQGATINLKNIFPISITQMGFGSSDLLDALPDYPFVKAFTASGFANR